MKWSKPWVALMFFVPTLSYANHTHLSLSQAIDQGLQHDRTLQASLSEVRRIIAETKSVRGRFGPIVELEANAFVWDGAAQINVVDPNALDLGSLPPEFQQMLGGLLSQLANPIEVREKTTSQVKLSLIQPLTPLYSVYQGHQIGQLGQQAAQAHHTRAQQQVVFQITQAYFQLAKIIKLHQVAQAAQNTIRAHVNSAKQFLKQGLINKSDVLAAEVELANATQQRIKAHAGVQLARSLLATRVGLPIDSHLTIDELDRVQPKSIGLSLEQAQQQAMALRPEIQALHKLIQVAERKTKIAWWELTPSVSAVARYQHNEGVSLQPYNEYFVGAVLNWKLWEWGRSYYLAQAESEKTTQAQLKLKNVRELIQLEVKQRYLALDSAHKRLTVTQKAVKQAQENLRLEKLRFAQNTATSTDVLDAQTRLTQAQGNLVAAKSDVSISHAALVFSLGRGIKSTPQPSAKKKIDPNKDRT